MQKSGAIFFMKLEQFVGNAGVKKELSAMIKNGRIPHAVLIEGESLSGRKTLAGILARAAACMGEGAPCGTCSACRLSDNPDITYIMPDEKGSIKVDVARQIRTDAYILPNNSARRVFIVCDAHLMNDRGQNALLKVIEEPPERAMFILVCEYAQQLLETVRSRCVRLSVHLPTEQEAREHLSQTTDFAADDIALAVKKSCGNIGQALRYLQGEIGMTKTALAMAEASLHSELELLKLFVPYEKDILALKSITQELENIYHNAMLAKQGMNSDPDLQAMAKRATKQQWYAACTVCQQMWDDFDAVIPLTKGDGALYSTALCSKLMQALA